MEGRGELAAVRSVAKFTRPLAAKFRRSACAYVSPVLEDSGPLSILVSLFSELPRVFCPLFHYVFSVNQISISCSVV